MQLLGRLEIKSKEKINEFLNKEHIGRIASIDKSGFPEVIPMNFVFIDGSIYMHSHTKGEKLDNIRRNSRVGFEVDRELEFLPSYFEDPKDASLADTLYVSVVIKGNATLVSDRKEKVLALNGLMKKYQQEGGYEPLQTDMSVIDEVEVIKVIPDSIKGKYKIGQHLNASERKALAEKILKRNSPTAKETVKIMGFEIGDQGLIMKDEPVW
ncbi:MAG: pyridoxamine 5'-phosphate oxidase family protein [Nitrosopumilaceae archaeon]|nr:pyridoxamine 5'-phosphate oxidase family protein [Nitrosopumilaceae archaeon]NIU00553.1 pyridoxamine 5'-phosphate oxidase family protein [Nitrosopumilaceae archaeon]NIU86939.1 pyridoxamine 5'-phosphate oxidase family protein [Nitrosopumilaceae archaeon]NIV66403.1 pyridoxamine 5'-phosphate oxidase family protein [Nitrosopumilaceae archaeon]NIX61155.1 pyridoxamine 5'-phosphate oxidase family protein [Nitrosopumilaceae archaeon]